MISHVLTTFSRKLRISSSFSIRRRRNRRPRARASRESTRDGSASRQSTGSASWRGISRSPARTTGTRWQRGGSRMSLGRVGRGYVREGPAPRITPV